jgi:hypothetical protein
MDGLIASAKAKLWDVVNDLARAKPTPELRVAVLSYGNNAYDAEAGWVRLETDLTADLDKVSEKLTALQATKVSGSNEYVGRVCRDALQKLKWSNDRQALRVVFVCGNEKADQDPDVTLASVVEDATKRDIVINTIFCGGSETAQAAGWREFAKTAGGRFVAIDQDRAVTAVTTPFDKELAELSGKLNHTFCFSGKNANALSENQKAQDANALQLGDGAAASRAQSKAGGIYRFEGQDLVDRLRREATFDVKKVPEAELTDELKKMKPEEREKHVRALLAKREDLEKQIGGLAKKRDEYIREELKKSTSAAGRAFDEAVRGTLRDQAKKKGLTIPE